MKIMIYGFSGSGKSTLTEIIANEYSLPILYIDKTLYHPEWNKKDHEESYNEIKNFLMANKNWIIDGNAINKLFDERANLADTIIYMKLPRVQCYKNARKRYLKYKNKERNSRPEGCSEKFDFSFKLWILFTGRKKKRVKTFDEIANKYKEKIIILKNKKDVEYFIKMIGTQFTRH